MKRFLLAFLLTSVGFHHHAIAATCERRLGLSPGLTPQDQVRVLRQLAIDGCELIAVRFSEQSRGGGLLHSQVLLDLDDAALVRVIKQGGATSAIFLAWSRSGVPFGGSRITGIQKFYFSR